MIFVSQFLDRYYKMRLKSAGYRKASYKDALDHSLRGNKLGRILLRNLNEVMAENPTYHEEFSALLNGKDYQAAFWESDLGYLWYEGNLRAQNKYFNRALDLIKNNQYTSILDVGCGWGEFSARAAQLPGVDKVIGIDISNKIIEQAKKLHAQSKASFFERDVLDESGTYDLVVLFGSTDYIRPSQFRSVLVILLSIANKEILLVNSLRKIPFEKSLELKDAKEIMRYDTGYVHPIRSLLEELKKENAFTYTIEPAGTDSVWVSIRK